MNGSFTATSSTSLLCRATLATKRPILPNPDIPQLFSDLQTTKTQKQKQKQQKHQMGTIDSNLDLLVRAYKHPKPSLSVKRLKQTQIKNQKKKKKKKR